MAIPGFQDFMLPVLRLADGRETRVADIVDVIADQFNLSDADREELLPSGTKRRLLNRLHWATIYLHKSGLIVRTRRGYYTISDRGRRVLTDPPARIDIAFLGQFDEFRAFVQKESADGESAGPDPDVALSVKELRTPDEILRGAHQQIEGTLAQELLDRVRAGRPEFFETLLIRLLLAMGYGGSAADAGRALGRSGDDGVDGVIDQDALGLDRVYVQAKRYKEGSNVGSAAIRDFFGSLDRHKAAKGLFVTTSSFSSSARETAEFLSKRIVLVDGAQLATLMIRHNVGCRIEEAFYIKKIDEDFFE